MHMDLNYSGVIYRIWAVAGIIVLLGVADLLACGIRTKSFSKSCFYAGLLAVLFGLGIAAYYANCYVNPKVDSVQGVFCEEYRNSRVAPPLPLTMEYTFSDADGKKKTLYLDVLSKKEIIPEGFEKGQEYLVSYEVRNNIILKAEPVS